MGKLSISSVWQVAREYAGIAEAGGVKNVVCSLAEGFVRQGIDSTVFLPLYGCVLRDKKLKLALTERARSSVAVGNAVHDLVYYLCELHGVTLLFVGASVFSEKQGLYTYTAEDEKRMSGVIRGQGYADAVVMNMVLQKAVAEYARLTQSAPDVLLCQDAHTAILPALIANDEGLARLFRVSCTLVCVHNAGPGYHQEMKNIEVARDITGLPVEILRQGMLNGAVEPFLLASLYARLITVSPWYARELTDPSFSYSGGLSAEFSRRGVVIEGITNGIDYDKYDPENTAKSLLPAVFNPLQGDFAGKAECTSTLVSIAASRSCSDDVEQFGYLDGDKNAVYFSYHGRIAAQKGLDVLYAAARRLLNSRPETRFIVIGQGDPALEGLHMALAQEYPGRYLFLRGYERSLARLSVAAADFLVLPSLFEPCGLEDFIGQIYGTIPVAHAVGGLQKILNGTTGFLYPVPANDAGGGYPLGADGAVESLVALLTSLTVRQLENPGELDAVRVAAARYVKKEYVWDAVIAKKYLPLFELNRRKPT